MKTTLALCAAGILVAGCNWAPAAATSGEGGASTSVGGAPGTGGAPPGVGGGSAGASEAGGGGVGGSGGGIAPPFKVRGSVEQVDVWKAQPSTAIELRDATGAMVQQGTTDTLGSFLFRNVPPGDGYEVRESALDPVESVKPIHVMSVANSQPPQSFYANQHLVPGVNYITTRDGTQLSAYITLPGDASAGPYPTMVNYSGYNPSQPGAPVPGDMAFCGIIPALCDAPSDPSGFISAIVGYATVSVNMRGTGCSGGAYDYFEELQLLDGYDVIEAVAAQPWVLGNRVGMTGLSYPGITQLFVAETHPPSLAAITPLSVIGGTYSTARPGGIFNTGFALEWISQVLDKADPYGQGWEQGQVDAGDTVCEENQLLHGQKANVVQEAQDNPYYSDALVGRVDPTTFVHDIDVPVFLAGAFQDEQTGPFFFTLLDQFTSSPVKRFNIYNGVHVDGFAPQILVEWKTFLDIYVAHRVPSIDPNVRALAPALFQNIYKVSMPMPPDRFASYATWEEAKAAYEAEQPVRLLFEDGGLPAPNVGAPEATMEQRFDAWPVPTTPLRLYFQADGTLTDTAPTAQTGGSTFQLDPAAGTRGILAPGGDVWDPLPAYAWAALPAGFDVVVVTPPLPQDLVMIGTASVDLWIRSPVVDDADLEVNLTEVRDDGQEMFVQSGWLRASLAKLSTTATDLWPEHTYKQADEALLVPGKWTKVRVGIPAFSHAFRAGSRIRVTVDTPGDSRAAWQFELKTFPGTVTYDIGESAYYASSILLPVLGGQAATTVRPPCPSLRGQQCRPFVDYLNTPSAP